MTSNTIGGQLDWRQLAAATPEERQRGEALRDAADYCRRMTAALLAAQAGECDSRRAAALNHAHATLEQVQRELEQLL